ncbi:MAG TPA: glycosyltransferase [Lacibacter sp.]|nr:glycosyltransferase [Lacibacter sp.]HMO89688.1 glycosyltransferase [Lacibacter sp.]
MHVLWLCSWYPGPLDPYDGDFIERHAASLATCQPVQVIHLVQNTTLLKGQAPTTTETKAGQLQATVHALSWPGLPAPLDRLVFNRNYRSAYRRILAAYIETHGRPDLVHVHVPVKAGAAALWLKMRYGIPFIASEHNSAYFPEIPGSYATRNRYFRYITEHTFRQAKAVTSVSEWLTRRLEYLFQLPQTAVVRNAVDTHLFYPGLPTKARFRFLHVSMLLPLKNAEGILDALALLQQRTRDWELVLVGPAPDALRARAARLGLSSQVIFTGALSYGGVAEQMRKAHALVHFSRYENLPCVINEALCCGLPVVSSDVGGIRELVQEENGILVPEGNLQELADALYRLMLQYTNYDRVAISVTAQEAFNYAAIGKAWVGLYNRL